MLREKPWRRGSFPDFFCSSLPSFSFFLLPFGGGPLLALLGFAAFPLVWAVPEALITAELSTLSPAKNECPGSFGLFGRRSCEGS